MATDPDIARVNNAAAALAEHFDSVLIIATKTEKSGTSITHTAKGNWYAVKGAAREWLERNDERSRESIRHENDDNDD